MDNKTLPKAYEQPRVIDYGGLQELTAACAEGTGGDAFAPSGNKGGINFGASNPAYGCKSTP